MDHPRSGSSLMLASRRTTDLVDVLPELHRAQWPVGQVLRDAIAAACFEFGVRTVDWPAPTYCWPPNEDADVAGQLCAIVEAWVRAADDHERHRLAGPLRGPQQTSVSLDGVLVGATAGEITEYDLDTPTTDHDLSRGEGRGEYAPIQRRLNYDGATRTRIGDPIPAAAPFVYPGFLRPDGKAVAVTVRDGVAVWNIDLERLADAACELADRNLTDKEWQTYLGELGAYRKTCPPTSTSP